MRVMLIMPSFFNYPDVIVDELSRAGVTCDRFNDRPSDASIVKAAIRLKKGSLQGMVRRHLVTLLDAASKNSYDKVLVISGQSLCFGEEELKRLRAAMPDTEFILYQWDAVANYPRILDLLPFFDRTFSFDAADAKLYGMEFMPLFYHRGYGEIGVRSAPNPDYDLLFIGTAHPKKHEFVKEVVKTGKFDISRCLIYEFLPSRLVYMRHKIKEPSYKDAKLSDFHYLAMSPGETESAVERSRIVLDSPQAGQRGLTMRTLECLGASRKLITTNTDVKFYDFYRPENIYVYNGWFDKTDPFFVEPYRAIEEDIRERYALTSWLKVLLDEKPVYSGYRKANR